MMMNTNGQVMKTMMKHYSEHDNGMSLKMVMYFYQSQFMLSFSL